MSLALKASTLDLKTKAKIFLLVSLIACPLQVSLCAVELDEDTIAELKEIQSRNQDDIFNMSPGIFGFGIGEVEGEIGFKIFVDPDAYTSVVPSIPGMLEGKKVEIVVTEPFVRMDGGPAHRIQYPFPVPMGTSTSNGVVCGAGTLGFKVCDASNANIIGYITNNHVATVGGPNQCSNQAGNGTIQYHVGTGDAQPQCSTTVEIGRTLRFDPLNLSFTDPPPASRVDAAFIQSDDTRISNSILDIGVPTTTPRNPSIGDLVRKSGRTTGLTTGRVSSISTTFIINDDHSGGTICGKYLLANQIAIDAVDPPTQFLSAGDSGAPVVDSNNNPVGLLFAGNPTGTMGAANPITDVLSVLNVTFNCGARWESLGGILTSAPAAVTWGSNGYRVFARGLDNALWVDSSLDGFNLSGWSSLGGILTSNPAAVSWGVNGFRVFARGQDNALWVNSSPDGTNLSGWQWLGGILTSDPAAVPWGSNGYRVFVRGLDNALWVNSSSDGFSFTGWQWLGGILTSTPAASISGAAGYRVFARGLDNALWINSSPDGIGSTGWQWLGGVLSSDPGAVAWGTNGFRVFVRGLDDGVWYKTTNDGVNISGWISLGGTIRSKPTAASNGSTVHVFVQGSDNSLYHLRQ